MLASAAIELAATTDGARPAGRSLCPRIRRCTTSNSSIYLEQVDNLAPGALLPVAAGVREVAQRKLNQMLRWRWQRDPRDLPWAANTVDLADPPLVLHDEAPPALCLTREMIGAMLCRPSKARAEEKGSPASIHLLTPEALAQLQRFCLRSTVWRRPYPPGYIGANPESGFFSPLLLQIAAELRHAVPELLG